MQKARSIALVGGEAACSNILHRRNVKINVKRRRQTSNLKATRVQTLQMNTSIWAKVYNWH